ncbi:hypothetical protein Goari_002914, partial [Gossypium aridum]|nr:hypothetical protein [Gossypium aridum]
MLVGYMNRFIYALRTPKKIYEISTLCGAEILFVIFSPIGKPYSFVHPSIKSTAKRFLNANQPLNDTISAPVEAFHK